MESVSSFWPYRQGKDVPVWVAAHSPISKYDKDRTISLFQKYEEIGVSLLTTGEIILDCLDDVMNGPVIRLKAHKGKSNSPFGFHLLGPAEPNLLPASIGISLCETAVKVCKRPIVANIGCFNTDMDQKSVENLKSLINTGISAFEIALSCPGLDYQNNQATWWEESFKLIERIRMYSDLPISLKIGYQNTKNIDLATMFKFCNVHNITQITAIDGIKLICPPKIGADTTISMPFDDYPALCYSGTHGSWNRLLLYDSVATLKNARDKYASDKIKISAVGGIMSAEHAFEAMALGADNVQLSSLLFWNGIKGAKKVINDIAEKRDIFNKNMSAIKFGVIDNNPKEGFERHFGEEYIEKWNSLGTVSATDTEKCVGCELCCNTPCLARKMDNNVPILTEHLCSGCGWCRDICPTNAICMKKRF